MQAAHLQDLKGKFATYNFGNKRLVARSFINYNSKQFILPVLNTNMPDKSKEDANTLPSKENNKKSEITLIPLKPKTCGCSEPCEIIICEVRVQQCVDQDEISFMLAMNIEEEEIDACVTKHCDNKYCDALSIDHNRCRRGLIELYKCDISNVCDICRITMKGWKSRLHHKGCERKNKYRHNNVSQDHLLKDRFRLRELEILEESKITRNNYLDPINGPILALEAIQNNKELIIIPNKKSGLTITTVPSASLINVNQPILINSQASNSENTISKMIKIRSQNNPASSFNHTPPLLKEDVAQRMDPVQLSSTQQNKYIATPSSTTCTTVGPPLQNRYIHLSNSSSTSVQPVTTSNLVAPQSPHVTTNSAQFKPLLGPIRVMPITNLKTAPSLLHRQQGIPKFCVMAGNVITTLSVSNVQTLQPIIAANITAQQEQVSKIQPVLTQNQHIFPQKLPKKEKQFFCVYCCKQFSTYWYLKRHVAKHEKEKHTPQNLVKFLGDKHDTKSHFSTDWYIKKHIAKHEKEKHIPRILTRSLDDRHDTKSNASKKYNIRKEFDHDYACDSPYSLIRSPANRTDGELEAHEPHVQLEYDIEDCDEKFADKMNSFTTFNDFNQVQEKKIKCEEMVDTWNGNIEIFRNGIKIEAQDDTCLEDVSLEDYNVEESFSENCNTENKFTIASVVGNTNFKNFEEKEEHITTLR